MKDIKKSWIQLTRPLKYKNVIWLRPFSVDAIPPKFYQVSKTRFSYVKSIVFKNNIRHVYCEVTS